ncbi:MAG TPA: hypothetical protein DDX51_02020 [Clostridiales bacterium]|nr:hypothetical protein [Clostridiales bacterium]
MRAFASNWTRPYAMRRPGQPYEIPDYELLTTILSALMWRRNNGSIRMITDRVGARYYRSLGLAPVWDDGISCELDDIPYTVDPSTFWAAGKLYALSHVPAPCAMIDTDFIVWCSLRDRLKASDLTVIHQEPLSPDIYPDPSAFVLSDSYAFPSDWDWSEPACNTAFAWFGKESLRRTYLTQALDFVHAVRGRDSLIYMVFAEQRLLGMCARAQHIRVDTLSDPDALFDPKQTDFTHIWGFKQALASHDDVRAAFCHRCASRIIRDFPAYRAVCAAIPSLRNYF